MTRARSAVPPPPPGRPRIADARPPGLAWPAPGDALAVAAIVLLGVLAYSGSIGAPFVYDDRPSILENAGIQDLASYVWSGAGARPSRYVGYLSFAVSWWLGGAEVAGYRLLNVAIHVANALLVYALVRLSFRTPVLSRSALASSSAVIAFAASALFVTHPLATQAVTYVVQRLTSLATMFYLATVVLYVRWRLGEGSAGARRRWPWYAAMLASAVAAMNTKEIAFTVPLCVLLYERCFFGALSARRLASLAPLVATMALVPLARLRAVGDGAAGPMASLVESATRVQTDLSRWEYGCTQLTVLVKYLRLLVAPVGQSFAHDHPTYASLVEPRVAASGALLAGLGVLAFVLLRKREWDASGRLAAFGIAWFFVTASVESSILPIVDVIGEHRAYLPSVGAFVAFATGAASLARRLSPARGAARLACGAAAVALALSIATFQRNEVWASEISLWSDVVAKSPRNARAHESLGTALADAGRVEEAARRFGAAIELDPRRPEPYYNLARLHLAAGVRPEDAAALLARAVELRPDWGDAYANLAAALNRMGRYSDAVRLVETAPDAARRLPECRFNLGVAYAASGDVARAEAELMELRRASSPLAVRLAAYLRR